MAEGTEEKAEYQVLLSENYALDTDKLNLVLKERFQKRDGKGKFANVVEGEYSWKPIGYFNSLRHVAGYIVKHELMKEDEKISELRHYASNIEALKLSIESTLLKNITIVRE